MEVVLDELYLKCDICQQFHNYNCDQQSLIALNADWLEPAARFGLLTQKPSIDKYYHIKLQGRLKINLRNPVWILWLDPVSHVDGLETEQGIEQILFCLCDPAEIIVANAYDAVVKIKVTDIKSIYETELYVKPQIKWHTMLDTEATSKHHYDICNFKNYSLIRINVEGDLGMQVIIKKQNRKSRIVALNEWDFHLNVWYAFNEVLNHDQEVLYGILYP